MSRVPTLSVVIPAYNEEETLPEMLRRTLGALEGGEVDFELLFVNDGSADRTAEMLDRFAAEDPRVAVVHLARNFGHQVAVSAGLSHARGRAVAVLDADLQDPPEVLLEFLRLWREGSDVVYGVRRKRKEGLLKRAAYDTFYRLLAQSASFPIPRDSGDFCLMDRRVVDQIVRMPERDRFVRGLRAWVGLRQTPLEYERDARFAGAPKYTVRKLYRLAAQGFVSFSVRPLHLSMKLGFVMAAGTLAVAAGYTVLRVLDLGAWPPGFATLFIGICFLFSLQFVLIGILGEYVGSIHTEVKQRPLFHVARTRNLGEEDDRRDDPAALERAEAEHDSELGPAPPASQPPSPAAPLPARPRGETRRRPTADRRSPEAG